MIRNRAACVGDLGKEEGKKKIIYMRESINTPTCDRHSSVHGTHCCFDQINLTAAYLMFADGCLCKCVEIFSPPRGLNYLTRFIYVMYILLQIPIIRNVIAIKQ